MDSVWKLDPEEMGINPAKTWEMQLIDLLFVEASAEIVSVEGWWSRNV